MTLPGHCNPRPADSTTNGDWLAPTAVRAMTYRHPGQYPSYITITLTNQTTDMDDTGVANAALEQPSGGGRYPIHKPVLCLE